MNIEKDLKTLANSSTITLDEAQSRLVKAMTTRNMKMTKEQIKLFTCPWWKFWNGWF
jgi:hypothetical protein